jgi:mono/diheme cytochrome c family protein
MLRRRHCQDLSLPAALLTVLSAGVAPAAAQQAHASGRELYQSGCAACHGPDGRGMPKSVVGFDIPLPDFTDCSFATPEADVDWLAIAHSGGPVRAFDRRMPAFGEALSTDDLLAIIRHIRTFCSSRAWPRGELNLPRPLVTEKAFPESEAVLTTTVGTKGATSIGNELLYERRLGSRSQFEVIVPLDLQEQTTGDWDGGLGDVAVAIKHVLFHGLDRGAIVSLAAEVTFPTGDDDIGLGGGVTRIEPFIAYGQMLPRNYFLQVQAGSDLSTNTNRAAHEAFWRVTAGRTLFERNFGRAWSPMLELLGAREFGDADDAQPGEMDVQWDVVPQVQVSLSRRQHVLVNVGVRVPLNNRDQRGAQLITYLLWDWFDGGLLSGWR